MLLFFSRSRRKLTVESSFSSFASSANCASVLERCSYSSIVFLEQFFQRVQFSPGTSMALTMGGSADTLHKVKHASFGSHYSVHGREGKWRCRSDSVQNTSYSGEGRDWMRKTRGSFELSLRSIPAVAIPNILISRSERCKINQNTIITVCRIIPFCRSEM